MNGKSSNGKSSNGKSSNGKALIELVRAPAALTVLGDTVAGAAAAGTPLRGRRWALPLSSAAFYWAGMALNDWSDRELDAVERPERPIPSGRISARTALGIAGGLTVAGVGIAAFAGGRRTLGVALPLAAAVWTYDTRLKGTALGPAGMAVCRALDVLLGAGPDARRVAAPAAAALGVHTLGVTALSAGEVHGGSRRTAEAAVGATAVSAGIAVAGPARSGLHRLAGLGLGGTYAATVGKAQFEAAQRPSAEVVRKATMAGIHGMVPLQAGLAARHGSLRAALALAAALPLAGRLAKRVSPT